MAARPLYIPIAKNYAAAPGAGSGLVQQWVYIVPAGKIARLYHSFYLIDVNAAAANTLAAIVKVSIGGVLMTVGELTTAGNANSATLTLVHWIDLNAGDSVSGNTVNTGAANPVIIVNAIIREYQ